MKILSQFKPAWWAKNRHLQTVWGALFRFFPLLPRLRRIRLELADGDFIDIDIHFEESPSTVLILHGLEGSVHSHYIRGLVAQFIARKQQVAVMHFRGCSGESNRLLKSYHSGASEDLHQVVELLQAAGMQIDYLVGFSLGGNIVLKWLAEIAEKPNSSNQSHSCQNTSDENKYRRNSASCSIKAAVAVSVPYLLDECANTIDKGFSRVYSRHLLKTLRKKVVEKRGLFSEDFSLSCEEISQLKTFWSFDHQVTAPVNGFLSAEDYYRKVSSRQFLSAISVPTLLIHAKDDPFMSQGVIPELSELSPFIQLEISERGGHVGFIQGKWPFIANYYLDHRIPEFLSHYQE